MTNETPLPRFGLLPLASLLLLAACAGPQEMKPVHRDLLADTQAVSLDYGSPSFRFDGRGGSLLPTQGWAPPEAGRQPKDTPFFAWTIGDEATLVFTRPPSTDLDFFARARSFVWSESPPQSMTLRLNGVLVDRLWIAAGWQTYRTRLPTDSFVDGLNEITLEFAYSGRPNELTGGRDKRDLSVAFSDLALLPGKVTDPWVQLETPRFDEQRWIAELPVWGGLSIPVPGATSGRLKLGAIDSKCLDCELIVEVSNSRGKPRELWRGPLGKASGAEWLFHSPPAWAAELGLRIMPPRGREVSPAGKTMIAFPADYLQLGVPDRPSSALPPVFLYMVDTLRADALEIYGGPADSSPRLTGFAQRAVTYKRAWSPSSWTLPSVASLFTGLLPSRHQMGLVERKLPGEGMPVMARLLADGGYQTLGVSQSFVASAAFGLESGFERYLLSNQLNGRELRSSELRRYLLHLLTTADPDRTPFVYLHNVDTHSPYLPQGKYRQVLAKAQGRLPESQYRPRPFMFEGFGDDPQEVAHLRALYQGEVAFTDDQFGRFLDLLTQLTLLDESMIVFLSDHGEEFGEHGAFDHGRTVHQEMLDVPLLIQFPGARWPGSEIDNRVSLLDVLPTILAETGLESDHSFDGIALQPDRLPPRPERPVFAETSPKAAEDLAAVDLQAMAIDGAKCIHSSNGEDQFSRPVPRWQVFDLDVDPAEQEPLAPEDSAYAACVSTMEDWLRQRAGWLANENPLGEDVADDDLEMLRALGYIE